MRRRFFLKLISLFLPISYGVKINAESISAGVELFQFDINKISTINGIINIVFPSNEIQGIEDAKVSEYINEYFSDCARRCCINGNRPHI